MKGWVGKSVEYYNNGSLKEKKEYNKLGKVHGDYEEFFVSGTIRARGYMKNGEMDGKWVFYYHNEQEEMQGKEKRIINLIIPQRV